MSGNSAAAVQTTLSQNISNVRDRIRQAAGRARRNPDDIRLVAVCKTVDRNTVDAAFELGLTEFGENRVQVALEKFEHDRPSGMKLHMIGSLQTNKARQVVGIFDLIHSLDRISLAKELDKRARNANLIQPVLIQVNVGREEQKHGCSVDEVPGLIEDVLSRRHLHLQGFMTMAPFHAKPEDTRPVFAEMREIAFNMSETYPETTLTELSMGMTNDFEVAVEEGATILRVGTAIFHGDRH